jgi:hypothetical protein
MRTAQVFVAVLGASSYTYSEATWTQTLPDWIGAPARALADLKGLVRPQSDQYRRRAREILKRGAAASVGSKSGARIDLKLRFAATGGDQAVASYCGLFRAAA